MPVTIMGKFTAISMRAPTKDLGTNPLVINTCGRNDTAEKGDFNNWVWCNPTNRALTHHYLDITAVSVECLWQGTKILKTNTTGIPDQTTLDGAWRQGKGKAPRGAYNGKGQPLITSPGLARRMIYVPAFRNLVNYWLADEEVQSWLQRCREHDGGVFLRDHDTGRGIDRNGPMSHAWLFCEFLNTGVWPDA